MQLGGVSIHGVSKHDATTNVVHGVTLHDATVNNHKMTSGNYEGTLAANRAVAHGLGVAPKLVFIFGEASAYNQFIFGDMALIKYISDGSSGVYAVTQADATNFYVGNAADYDRSANHNATDPWHWVAIA